MKEKERPNKDLSITEKLDKVLEYFEAGLSKKDKSKKFKLPFKARSLGKKMHKKSKVLVILVSKGKIMKPIVTNIIKGMIKIQDNWHTVPTDALMLWKGKIPTIFLPEWQITPTTFEPIRVEDLEKQSEDDKNLVDAQTYAIRAIKKESSILNPKRFGGKAIIWIIIIGVAVAYFMFGGN